MRVLGNRGTVVFMNDDITGKVIAAAIQVHRVLGPGLLESAYQACLCRELDLRRISFEREVPLAVEYEGVRVDCGYRLDVLVEKTIVVEIKAVAQIGPIQESQLLTYMKLGGFPLGLLINFNVPLLRLGLRRFILSGKRPVLPANNPHRRGAERR